MNDTDIDHDIVLSKVHVGVRSFPVEPVRFNTNRSASLLDDMGEALEDHVMPLGRESGGHLSLEQNHMCRGEGDDHVEEDPGGDDSQLGSGSHTERGLEREGGW